MEILLLLHFLGDSSVSCLASLVFPSLSQSSQMLADCLLLFWASCGTSTKKLSNPFFRSSKRQPRKMSMFCLGIYSFSVYTNTNVAMMKLRKMMMKMGCLLAISPLLLELFYSFSSSSVLVLSSSPCGRTGPSLMLSTSASSPWLQLALVTLCQVKT